MGTFLFLLLLFFVIIPLIQVGWRIWQAQRTFSRMRQQMHDAMSGSAAGSRSSGRKETAKRKKKKIDPNVGEYVAFEEVRSATQTTASTDGGSTTVHTESQVEDAVWEEIR